MTNAHAYVRSLIVVTALLAAPAVQACQLVCIIAAGNLNDAGCSAAKSGFKVALKGMLSSLPQKGPEFYGNSYLHGGISCSQIPDVAALQMPWIAQGYGSGWPVEALTGTVNAPTGSGLTNQCNNRYSSGNESTVCCNM